ncbi:MAG: hypothetical protein P1P64_03575 [Treponemataceae bacterium]
MKEKIEYYFTDAELKVLAKLFNKSPVPKGLEKLYQFVKNYCYKTMTIAEAESFYGER